MIFKTKSLGTIDIGELRNAFFFWKQSVTDDELQVIMKKVCHLHFVCINMYVKKK